MLKLYYFFLAIMSAGTCTFILTTDKLEKYEKPPETVWKYNQQARVPHWYKGVSPNE